MALGQSSRVTVLRKCLQITLSVQCLGAAWRLFTAPSVMLELGAGHPDAGGWGWSEAVARPLELGLAWLLLASVPWVLLWPRWPGLLALAWVFLSFACAQAWLGGHFLSHWEPAAHAVRFAAPLALALLIPQALASPRRVTQTIWLLRVAVAATFLAHGWEAWNLHPVFVDYLIAAGDRLLGIAVSQATAEQLLRLIGLIDLGVAILILTTRSSAVAFYMAFWGFITAGSRIVHDDWPGAYAALIRAANGGLPLALALYWWKTCDSEANDGHESK